MYVWLWLTPQYLLTDFFISYVTIQANAMGTFNILNGEDRMVAVALILPENEGDGYKS
jgi:hypothetical protein